MPELKRFFTPPVFQDDEEKTRTAHVLNTILLGLSVVYLLAGLAVLFVFVEKLGSLLIVVVLLSVLLVVRFSMQRGQIRFASALLVSGLWVGVTILVSFAGGMTCIHAAYYIMVTVIAGLLLGTHAALVVAGVCSLTGLAMVVVESIGYPLPRVFPVPASAGWLNLTFGLFMATIALNITLRSLHDALALARQQLEERKKAEEALRESEKRYRRLFEGAVLGVFQSTPEGGVITVNPAFARMFGYESPADVIASVKNVATDIFAEPQRRSEIMRLMAERPELRTFENLYRRKDGSTFTGNLHVWPVKDADGRLRHLEGFIEDITERKRTEEALRASEERFRALVETRSDWIWK